MYRKNNFEMEKNKKDRSEYEYLNGDFEPTEEEIDGFFKTFEETLSKSKNLESDLPKAIAELKNSIMDSVRVFINMETEELQEELKRSLALDERRNISEAINFVLETTPAIKINKVMKEISEKLSDPETSIVDGEILPIKDKFHLL